MGDKNILMWLLFLAGLAGCTWWYARENQALARRLRKDLDDRSAGWLIRFIWSRTIQLLAALGLSMLVIIIYDWQLRDARNTINDLNKAIVAANQTKGQIQMPVLPIQRQAGRQRPPATGMARTSAQATSRLMGKVGGNAMQVPPAAQPPPAAQAAPATQPASDNYYPPLVASTPTQVPPPPTQQALPAATAPEPVQVPASVLQQPPPAATAPVPVQIPASVTQQPPPAATAPAPAQIPAPVTQQTPPPATTTPGSPSSNNDAAPEDPSITLNMAAIPGQNAKPPDAVAGAAPAAGSETVKLANIVSPGETVDDVYNPEKKGGDNQSAIDDIKKRYEDILVTYMFLKKCGKVTPEDYHIITSALAQEMASVNAPGRMQYDILTAAEGSYKEMYAQSNCNGQGFEALHTQYTDYIKVLSDNFPAPAQ